MLVVGNAILCEVSWSTGLLLWNEAAISTPEFAEGRESGHFFSFFVADIQCMPGERRTSNLLAVAWLPGCLLHCLRRWCHLPGHRWLRRWRQYGIWLMCHWQYSTPIFRFHPRTQCRDCKQAGLSSTRKGVLLMKLPFIHANTLSEAWQRITRLWSHCHCNYGIHYRSWWYRVQERSDRLLSFEPGMGII